MLGKPVNEESRDSPRNWITVVLSFTSVEYEVFREIILLVAPRVKRLKEKGKILTWHFRYGSYGADVSFRLKFKARQKERVVEDLQQLVKELERRHLIKSCQFDDPAFKFTQESIMREHGSWRNWQLLIECDELLSEVVYKILTLLDYKEGERFFHRYVVHDLFNMFTKQEFFGSYELQQGKHRQLISAHLLTDQSAGDFAYCLDNKGYEQYLQRIPLRSLFFFEILQLQRLPKQSNSKST